MPMPDRVQMMRRKGWRKPDHVIYVGRPTRWGNPYVVGEGQVKWTGIIVGPGVGFYDPADQRIADVPLRDGLTAVEAVELYRIDLLGSLNDHHRHFDGLRDALEELRGHDLACWCSLDEPCHADVLIELANR